MFSNPGGDYYWETTLLFSPARKVGGKPEHPAVLTDPPGEKNKTCQRGTG